MEFVGKIHSINYSDRFFGRSNPTSFFMQNFAIAKGDSNFRQQIILFENKNTLKRNVVS